MRSKLLVGFVLVLLIFYVEGSCFNGTSAAQQVADPLGSTAKADDANQASETTASDAELESIELTTAKFADVATRTRQEIEIHGIENVILVVDIDNTILAMDQPLGSDQWYNWQYDFIFRDVESEFRVAKDLGELLHVQGMLFALGKMHPPEPSQPKLIGELQSAGCCTIVLTSRGPEFRNATERELIRNGYNFQQSALEILEPVRGNFFPYDKDRPNINGLSIKELASLRQPRPISYSNGIMMTAGQHKGYMLRTLLARSQRTFKAIVFVDDHEKHTTRMSDAFKHSNITTACFHYIHERPNVDEFEASDKEMVSRQWNELKSAIKNVFTPPEN